MEYSIIIAGKHNMPCKVTNVRTIILRLGECFVIYPYINTHMAFDRTNHGKSPTAIVRIQFYSCSKVISFAIALSLNFKPMKI